MASKEQQETGKGILQHIKQGQEKQIKEWVEEILRWKRGN